MLTLYLCRLCWSSRISVLPWLKWHPPFF